MSRRFFAPVAEFTDELELSGSEAHHLRRVLRMGVGDEIWLFNGQGREVRAEIVKTSTESVNLRVLERREAMVESSLQLTIATAVPKGDRFAWLIEKATELGVDRIIPLIAKRSIVDPGSGKLDKLRRTIIEASKQCGRGCLMELTEPQSWTTCLAQEFPNHSVLLAHPSGDTFDWSELVLASATPSTRPFLVLIGPEGGFTETEVEQALSHGARSIQLGAHILRIETAALAVAALFGQRVMHRKTQD